MYKYKKILEHIEKNKNEKIAYTEFYVDKMARGNFHTDNIEWVDLENRVSESDLTELDCICWDFMNDSEYNETINANSSDIQEPLKEGERILTVLISQNENCKN